MRKIFKNERGNAAFYMIWLLGIVAILLVIVLNISKVYIVGSQSSNSAEQAAIAGTAVIIDETKQAIEKFDNDPLSLPTRIHHSMKSIEELIDDKQSTYQLTGLSAEQAYIKALNNVLPSEIEEHALLKDTIKDHYTSVSLNSRIHSAVTSIIDDNHGNVAGTQWNISIDKWRLEVESTVDYKSISDQQYIPEMTEKISGEGYGPTLDFLEKIY